MVEFSNLAVVNTKELVNAGNHGFLATFAFGTFLLNKVIDRITILMSILLKKNK